MFFEVIEIGLFICKCCYVFFEIFVVIVMFEYVIVLGDYSYVVKVLKLFNDICYFFLILGILEFKYCECVQMKGYFIIMIFINVVFCICVVINDLVLDW